jgi:erythromycin esterase-like protein
VGALFVTPQHVVDEWIERAAIPLEPDTLAVPADDLRWTSLEECAAAARVVVLGELNHFVHEKVDFRLWWLKRLTALAKRDGRRIVLGEELSWFDGIQLARYLADGDEIRFDRLWTFGYKGNRRRDRDDSTTGILAASERTYPTALFKAEQLRFYRSARALGLREMFGFDIGGHDAGYELIGGRAPIARVHGETMQQEGDRLERVLVGIASTRESAELREQIAAMIDSLRYTELVNHAETYEALRPGMALREDAMKRRLAQRLARLQPRDQLVLMAHAFHLAKDDAGIAGTGVGPGGDRVPSLGHYLVRELGIEPFSVWWLYGAGEDSQPFPDLPRVANYPPGSLNAHLAARDAPLVVPVADEIEVTVGHMYNQVVRVQLSREADVVFFLPRVRPLQRV